MPLFLFISNALQVHGWELASHTKTNTGSILDVTRRTIYNYVERGWLEQTENGKRITTASIETFRQQPPSRSRFTNS